MRTLTLVGLAAAALGLSSVGGSAQAQRFANLSGGKLADLCVSRDRTGIQSCEAYIDGIADTVAFYQRLRPIGGTDKLPAYFCVPASVTGPQLRQVVVSWAEQHRDQLNRQASGIVLRALEAAYACSGAKNNLSE